MPCYEDAVIQRLDRIEATLKTMCRRSNPNVYGYQNVFTGIPVTTTLHERLVPTPNNIHVIRVYSTASTTTYITIYIDGVPIVEPAGGPYTLDFVPRGPNTQIGVECSATEAKNLWVDIS